jgi:hypothetical protein
MPKSQYPMIDLLIRHGAVMALVGALLVPIGSVVVALVTGVWLYVLVGIIGGAILYVLLKSYVELVAVMADMLLPK